MELGSIVYKNNLKFNDGETDIKQHRPCIFLYEEIIGNRKYAYIMSLTSKLNSFNKHYYKHVFVPESIYNYRKLSFAKLSDVAMVLSEDLIEVGQRLSESTIINIINRLNEYEPKPEYKDFYDDVRKVLNYIKPEEQKAKQKKLKRTKSA